MQTKVTQEIWERGIRERFPEQQSGVSQVGGLLACGQGREATWQGRFLVAGQVFAKALHWLKSQMLWLLLVMQQVCFLTFLTWDPMCLMRDPMCLMRLFSRS